MTEGHTGQWSQKTAQGNAIGENSCRRQSTQRARKRNSLKTLSTSPSVYNLGADTHKKISGRINPWIQHLFHRNRKHRGTGDMKHMGGFSMEQM